MKYFVLVALLGNSAAKHHHAHGLAQLSSPEESRNAWDATRNESWKVVAEQQRFQAEHNAMVAKNFADDTDATDAKKRWVENAYIRTMIGAPRAPKSTYPPTIFAQVSDPRLGEADAARQAGKAVAHEVVTEQEESEDSAVKSVEKRFKKDTKETNEIKQDIQKNKDKYYETYKTIDEREDEAAAKKKSKSDEEEEKPKKRDPKKAKESYDDSPPTAKDFKKDQSGEKISLKKDAKKDEGEEKEDKDAKKKDTKEEKKSEEKEEKKEDKKAKKDEAEDKKEEKKDDKESKEEKSEPKKEKKE